MIRILFLCLLIFSTCSVKSQNNEDKIAFQQLVKIVPQELKDFNTPAPKVNISSEQEDNRFWVTVYASDKYERTKALEAGLDIVEIYENKVSGIIHKNGIKILKEKGFIIVSKIPLKEYIQNRNNFVDTESKIVGNPKEVRPGEYEGVVFLQFLNYTEDGRSKLCTGTLISPKIVLTAGHCLYNLSSQYSKKDYTKYPEEIVVWKGVIIDNNLDPNDPRSGKVIAQGSVAAKWHPNWQGGAPSDAVDMGLILLPPDVTNGIKPYEINRISPETGKQGIIVGYGKTNRARKIIKNMGITKIKGISNRIINIGGESSICSGDSGGPLFVDMDGQIKVAGVASRTTFDCSPQSGSMTRVGTQTAWIDSVFEEWK